MTLAEAIAEAARLSPRHAPDAGRMPRTEE